MYTLESIYIVCVYVIALRLIIYILVPKVSLRVACDFSYSPPSPVVKTFCDPAVK